MKSSNVILGVLAGAAIGALVGILFAPDKGYNTRKKMYRKGEDLVDDLKDKADHMTEQAEQLAKQASRLVDKVNESIQAAKREAGGIVENAKAKFSEYKSKES